MARRLGLLLVTLSALVAVGGTAAHAATPPVAPPPPPAELTTATNAMLGFDLPAALAPAADSDVQIGYINPPGGQDPLPVCVYGPRNRTVSVPSTLAIGYGATNGYVGQSVYEYPSRAAADRAWKTLDAAIGAHCSGTWTDDNGTWTVSRTALPASGAAGRGWSATTTSPGSVIHVAVAPVGDAIQVVSYVRQSTPLGARVPAAIASLSGRLADRWAARATLPNTQGPLLTGATQSMLTEADVPAALPVTAPADGGWSSFDGTTPGNGPWSCAPTAKVPAGSWSFLTSLGGTGDILSEPGSLLQAVEVYQSDDAATAAWAKLRRTVLACADSSGGTLASGNSISRTTTGESALVVDGTAGVWSRQFSTEPSIPLSAKTYSIHLLSGNAIQTVTYYTTVMELQQIPLDQLAVNTLAEQLLQRWTTTQATQDAAG
jgi:hypothetical protein